ncbi:ubiquitin-specific protease otu1 [Vanrija albida]|uniref:Ubiquitin-specific protease otu1 n=1 Tax=Vanrija albida TaxID=181172 RepID=A0ABR3QEJ2_9TREE
MPHRVPETCPLPPTLPPTRTSTPAVAVAPPPTPPPAPPQIPQHRHDLVPSVDELQQLFARQLVGPSGEATQRHHSMSPPIASVDGSTAPASVKAASEAGAAPEPSVITSAEEDNPAEPQPPAADDTPPTPPEAPAADREPERTPSPAPTITALMTKAGLSPTSKAIPGTLGATLERFTAIEPLWMEFKSAFFAFEGHLGDIASGVHDGIQSHNCAAEPKEDKARLAAWAELNAKLEQAELENYALGVAERKALEEVQEKTRLLETYRADLEQVSKDLQDAHERAAQASKELEAERGRHEAMERAKVESVGELARLNLKTVELGKRYVVLEHDLEMANKENKSLQAQLGATAFVLVLVEAEARLFDPQLLKQGYLGGAQFADALKAETEKLYSMMHSQECPRVVINMYYDAAKVADELKENDNQVDEFLEGLSSYDLITISDVSGTFGASTKVKAQLGMLGSLRQCQMIVLVAGQDRKYLMHLNDLGPEIKNKVTAIRSTPLSEAANDPFRALGDDHLYHIPSVFPTSQAEWESISYHPPRWQTERPPQAPTNPTYHQSAQPQNSRRPEYGEVSTPRPPSNQHMAPAPINNGYQPQSSPATQYQSQQYQSQQGYSPQRPPADPRYSPERQQDHGPGRSDTYYSRGYDGNDNGYTREAPSGYQPERTPGPDHYSQQQPPPRAEATSHPPWQEFRAFSQAVDSTRQQAQPPTTRPRSPHIIHRRPGSSMGGSPASSDERNPPLPHIPAAARTHVVRPPAWRSTVDIVRPPTSTSLISTVTGPGLGGGPPPNWRVNMSTYSQGYNHQGQYAGQGPGQQGPSGQTNGQYESYSGNSDDRVQQWRASSDFSR